MGFQRETRTPLRTRLKAIHFILLTESDCLCLCPETFGEAEFKGKELIWLAEKISSQIASRLCLDYYTLLLARSTVRENK